MINEDSTFLSCVLFSDKANFYNNGQVNKHYWAMKNPYWMRTVYFQRSWTQNVWCGIVSNHIIRSHFFEESLNLIFNGEIYTDFLENILP